MKTFYKVSHIDLEGGFWGLISEDGTKYLPIYFPEQLKYVDRKVHCGIELLDDMMSSHGWGRPCRIVSFRTVDS